MRLRNINSILPLKAVFLFVFMCLTQSACKDVDRDNYKFITRSFETALQPFKPETFFNADTVFSCADVLFPEACEQQTELDKKRAKSVRAAKNQKILTEQICTPLANSYTIMLGSGLKGAKAYQFDKELTHVMRSAGAYALPLRIKNGYFKTTYQNPDWDKDSQELGGNKAFAKRYSKAFPAQNMRATNLSYKEKGTFQVTSSFPDGGIYGYLRFQKLHDYVMNEEKLKNIRFDLTLNFIHSYLFVLHENPDDITQETIFLYVDIPYTAHSDQYGNISRITQTEKDPDIHCYAHSVSQVRVRWRDDKSFIAGEKVVSRVGDFEPLTVPVHPQRFDGDSSYEISGTEISEPSLQCWMKVLGDNSIADSECLGTGYESEFIDVLNTDICVSFDTVIKAPTRDYPYKAVAGSGDFYIRGLHHFSPRCNILNDKSSPKAGDNERQAPQDGSFASMCSEIEEMYKNKTLNEIQVGFYPSNAKKTFSVDIDNDGDDELFKYFDTRSYAYVAEVKGDQIIGLPLPSEVTSYYSGNIIIKYNDKYFQMHFANGPYEIQRLTKKAITPDKDIRPIYDVETLCNYHSKNMQFDKSLATIK